MVAPELSTDRLILRAVTLADFDPYATMWADERVTNFIGGQPRSRSESWPKFCQIAGMWSLLGFGYWVWEERATGELAGCGGLANMERGIAELAGFPEAGWALTADHWGRGLATEAMAAVLGWAERTLKATEIRCIIDPGNDASKQVAAKLGFAQFGQLRNETWNTDLFRRERLSARIG